jgi:hypothetical protein
MHTFSDEKITRNSPDASLQMDDINIIGSSFHEEWNYRILPE